MDPKTYDLICELEEDERIKRQHDQLFKAVNKVGVQKGLKNNKGWALKMFDESGVNPTPLAILQGKRASELKVKERLRKKVEEKKLIT